MKIKDVLMKKGSKVITLQEDDSIGEAARQMTRHKIGAILVLNDRDDPAGIFTERDFVRIASDRSVEMETMKLNEAMTRDLIIGLADDDLETVLILMTEKRLRHLPVLENGELHGIISQGDVVKARLAHHEFQAHYMSEYIKGKIS